MKIKVNHSPAVQAPTDNEDQIPEQNENSTPEDIERLGQTAMPCRQYTMTSFIRGGAYLRRICLSDHSMLKFVRSPSRVM